MIKKLKELLKDVKIRQKNFIDLKQEWELNYAEVKCQI